MIIRKLSVEDLLDALEYLYESGVDYVNVHGSQGEEQDEVAFSFNKEYVNEEYKHNFEDSDEDIFPKNLNDAV